MIITSAVPESSTSSFSSSRTCAWMVTSSAVVGSSAISSRGSQASAIAISARCRIPPESWCGYSLQPPPRVGDADPAQQVLGLVLGLVAADVLGAASSTSVTWTPIGTTGFSEVIGSWKTIAMSAAAQVATARRWLSVSRFAPAVERPRR